MKTMHMFLKGYGKGLIVALAYIFIIQSTAWALPQGASVESGSVTFDSPNPNTLNINSASDQAIINWQSFNIAQHETVNFNQPSALSAILNRVIGGGGASSIAGALNSNGTIILVNPAGVTIAETANINVGSLTASQAASFVASSLNMTSSDFKAGNYIFQKEGVLSSAVINKGMITVHGGGLVMLFGGSVENSGTINAKLGKVVMASGDKIAVNFTQNGLISVAVDEKVVGGVVTADGKKVADAVKNLGAINADGGQVVLTAEAVSGIFDKAVNNEGIIKANTVIERNGVIELVSKTGMTVNKGVIQAKGTAAAPKGGTVKVYGQKAVNDGVIDVSAANGGTAGKVTVNSDVGGTILMPKSLIDASGHEIMSNAGEVLINSLGNTIFAPEAKIDISGGLVSGDAGFADVSAHENLGFWGDVDGFAVTGYKVGQLLLDPTTLTVVNPNPQAQDGRVAANDPGVAGASPVKAPGFVPSDDYKFGVLNYSISPKAIEDYNGDVSLEATATLTISSPITKDGTGTSILGALTLRAPTIAVNADLKAQALTIGGINASGAPTTTISSTGAKLTSTAGDITLNSNNTISGLGDITSSGGGISLNANNSMLKGNVTTKNDQTYNGALTLGGGSITFKSTDGTIYFNKSVVGGTTNMTINGTTEFYDTIMVSSITQTTGKQLNIKTAGLIQTAGAQTYNGTIELSEDATLQAGGLMTLGKVQEAAGKTCTFSATGSSVLLKDSITTKSVTLTASTGNIAGIGSPVLTGDADGTIQLVTAAAGGSIGSLGTLMGAPVTLVYADTLKMSTNITAEKSVNVLVGGVGGTLDLGTSAKTLTSQQGDIQLMGTDTIRNGNNTFKVETAGKQIQLLITNPAGGTVQDVGGNTFNGSLVVNATGNLLWNGDVTSANDITAVSTLGSVTLDGNLESTDGSIMLIAPLLIDCGGHTLKTSAAGKFSLLNLSAAAPGAFNNLGTVTGDLTLISTHDSTWNSPVTASGNIVINSNDGKITVGDTVESTGVGKTVIINAQDTVDVNGKALKVNTVNPAASIITLSIDADGEIKNFGPVTGPLVVNGTNDLTVGAGLAAAGADGLTIASQNGSVTLGADIASDGALMMTGKSIDGGNKTITAAGDINIGTDPGDIDNLGAVTTAGMVNIAADGVLTLNGNVRSIGSTVALVGADGINTTTAAPLELRSAGSLTIAAADVTINPDGSMIVNSESTMTLGNDLTAISDAGQILEYGIIEGTVPEAQNMTLTAGTLIGIGSAVGQTVKLGDVVATCATYDSFSANPATFSAKSVMVNGQSWPPPQPPVNPQMPRIPQGPTAAQIAAYQLIGTKSVAANMDTINVELNTAVKPPVEAVIPRDINLHPDFAQFIPSVQYNAYQNGTITFTVQPPSEAQMIGANLAAYEALMRGEAGMESRGGLFGVTNQVPSLQLPTVETIFNSIFPSGGTSQINQPVVPQVSLNYSVVPTGMSMPQMVSPQSILQNTSQQMTQVLNLVSNILGTSNQMSQSVNQNAGGGTGWSQSVLPQTMSQQMYQQPMQQKPPVVSTLSQTADQNFQLFQQTQHKFRMEVQQNKEARQKFEQVNAEFKAFMDNYRKIENPTVEQQTQYQNMQEYFEQNKRDYDEEMESHAQEQQQFQQTMQQQQQMFETMNNMQQTQQQMQNDAIQNMRGGQGAPQDQVNDE